MDRNEFRKQQFVALRREVEGQQWRSFLTVIFGLMGMPALGYFLLESVSYLWLILPLLVLVLIMQYLLQQNEMMRAGRYIREQLEQEELGLGWETWLESRAEYRQMEARFSGCFIIIFFLYFGLSLGIALYRLIVEATSDPSGTYWFVACGAAACYAITTVWAVATVLAHWRSCVHTTPKNG